MKIKLNVVSQILVSLLLITLINCNLLAQMFGQEPTERQRFYDVQHIMISLKLDLETKIVNGWVQTKFVPLSDNFNRFEVDAVGMNIQGVMLVNDKNTDLNTDSLTELKFTYDKAKINVDLPKSYKKGDTLIYSVTYQTTDPEKGLYFISPTVTFPNKPYQVWSQGEGEDNRYWIPCYDYPNEMASTEMYVTVKNSFQTLSNGILKTKTDNPDGTTTWHWVNELPHVSYLIMLGVGNWDVINDEWSGIPISSYVPVGQKEWGERSYRNTTDILKYFSEAINYKYPWGKFSQVAVEDYIYGGMENTGAVVLFAGSVYDASTEPDYNATGLVAHELAHQWWGDIVTCQNWNEIWLNESFATYFQCLYTEHSMGKDEFDYNIWRNGNSAMSVDSTIARKPIYARDGLTTNTYDKGSVVLNMLRYNIGDDNFWKAMNLYVTRHQHTPVVTKNLLDAVNETVNSNNMLAKPEDYSWFFEEWIYKAGQPEIQASYTYDDGTKEFVLTAKQIQRMDSSSVFKTQFPVLIITKDGVVDVKVNTGQQSSEYKTKLSSKPLCVIFNPGNKTLSKLRFKKPKSDWIYQLKNSQDAVDRITAITGLKDFINDNDVAEELLDRAKNDKFWGVRCEAAKMLANSTNRIVEDNYFKYLIAEPDSRIRKTYITGIATMMANNPPNSPNSQGILEMFLLELARNETSNYCTAEAITTLSKVMPKDRVYDMVIPFEDKDSHVDIIRRSVLAALDLSDDPRALSTLLEYAERGSTSRVRNVAIAGLENYLSDQKVIDFLNNKVKEKTRSTQNAILGLLEKANNPSSKPYLEELLANSNDEGFKKKVSETLQKIN